MRTGRRKIRVSKGRRLTGHPKGRNSNGLLFSRGKGDAVVKKLFQKGRSLVGGDAFRKKGHLVQLDSSENCVERGH